jgi:CRP-like cAMP-binding protein
MSQNSKKIVENRILAALPKDFTQEANSRGSLHRLLLRYTQALLMQVSQSAACNRFHSVEERFCRWILMTHDRIQSDSFPLTQDFISKMLGVRRPSISVVAAILQRAGLIRYSRGKMTVLDRKGLEDGCPCWNFLGDRFIIIICSYSSTLMFPMKKMSFFTS